MLRFKERFREARDYFEMNKTEFAKKLGISASTVTRYEDGSMDIAMGSIEEVAEKLGIRIEWLLGLSDNMYDVDIEYRNIPILKTVKNKPVFGLENYEGFEVLKIDYDVDFCIKTEGFADLLPSKTYFFKRQETAENGDTVAVISGETVSVASYFKYENTVMLISLLESGQTTPLKNATVIGKAVYEFSEVSHGKLQETR